MAKYGLKLGIAIMMLMAAMPCSVVADDDIDETAKTTIIIRPCKEPRLPLQHRLLPGFLDLRPGDAAPMYLKAIIMFNEAKADYIDDQETDDEEIEEKDEFEKVFDWLELPLEKFPRDDARKVLKRYSNCLELVRMGSLRRDCNWQLPIRESGKDLFAILLPELSPLRDITRLLALQSRLAIAEGRTADAITACQTGLVLARHIAKGETLISGLVGIIVAKIQLAQLETLLQQPGAPNLYWSLTALPSPLVDLRAGLETEAATLYLMFPDLMKAKQGQLKDEEWDRVLFELVDMWSTTMQLSGAVPEEIMRKWANKGKVNQALLLAKHDRSRKRLLARGYDKKRVTKMRPSQAILLDTIETFDESMQELTKWYPLPYWEAARGMDRVEEKWATRTNKGEVIPITAVLMPALSHVRYAQAGSQRKVVLLRTLEAIRLHAGANDGKLPTKLSDIKVVPVPANPMTGKLLDYSLKEDVATIRLFEKGRKEVQREYVLKLAK